MDNALKYQLIQFIREEIGEFDMEIMDTTELENDLGVTGDDGRDLIVKYANVFNVEISGFVFSKYFYPEPSVFSNYKPISSLNIAKLFEGVLAGKLT